MSVPPSAPSRTSAFVFGLSGAAAVALVVGAVLVTLTPAAGGAKAPAAAPQPKAEQPAPALDAGQLAAHVTEPAATLEAPERPPAEQPAPLDPKVRRRGVGTLALAVTPWAEVYEGRNRLGVTPMAPFELPIGRHVLTLKNPQLGVTRQVTVKVAKNQPTSLAVELDE